MVPGVGTALAWASGLLAQWTEEKIGVRRIESGATKDVLLTEGQGAHDILMLRASGPNDLDLEALAGSQRKLSKPHQTRIASTILALAWIGLLITVAGWEQHMWFLLGVGIIGMLHNVYVAGWERKPSALGISLGEPLKPENVFVNDKVMKVLWDLENVYPRAGASAIETFFPGGFENLKSWEKDAWNHAADRYKQWTAMEFPHKKGMPEIMAMPPSVWVDRKKFDSDNYDQSV